ncbi:valine--tRNA ligase [Haploplasma axanthum]|uniref:Valine--tRNA ligase n=1 Tax=Haploplasma axanthum TaxID=29552 RepID=A0A449BE87_HAPAX|nr:valine--tRNA ligase [Haploplasma axanthum]VEU80742.1 Valine--tRNA ligase [Haploplasma axanthum]
METKLSTKYDFKEVEKDRYNEWVKKNYFKADRPDLKPYTIVIPPPNVTGKLHLGHAWDNTLQDIIIRRKRMQGYDALYLPGMDHAGIATQAKVDEKLREQGISRYDLGREKFLEVAWDWKKEYSEHIRKQWAALGISVDYSKERFTLDEGLNKAVNHVFITMFNEGLIYRGNRIIQWDVDAKTALSNIEVEHKEELSKLYYFRYPFVADKTKYLVIATTRPETMFADQALMVHPDDSRYQKYIGTKVFIPGTNVEIPVIADAYVDMEFGTGVVKVTPAHDANDFEVGVRHNLKMPLCMNEDGTMNEMALEFNGVERFECRKNLTEKLNKLGLVEKIEDYQTSIGYSERTGVVVEPRLSLQWFIKMDDISKDSLKTNVEFVPERFKKIFERWMTDTQDWCISRQLWWGHRIPAWYKGSEVKVQIESPGADWHQDEDVLDTWFSSALWPFSTLGWPDKTADLERFYPTDVLVTGYDIIFFWVARMIFQGRHFTKEDPFKHVLLHGLIRDKDGRKMSKSLNNGVDPMDVISKYGVDALRYFLTTNSAPGADLRYDEEKVESSWNFINKLWNISRFVIMNLSEEKQTIDYNNLNLFDEWILSRLSEVITETDYYYEKFDFNEASRVLYNFIWNEFAAWYVELSKVSLQNNQFKANTEAVLNYVLEAILKLLHPFIPFVTDMLYQELTGADSIIRESWPLASKVSSLSIKNTELIQEIITKVRNLRAEHKVAPSKPLTINIVSENKELTSLFNQYNEYLDKFLRVNKLIISKKLELENDTIILVGENYSIYIQKDEIIDREQELKTLLKQKEDLEKEIERSKNILNNDKFLSKAPEEKINEEKAKYQKYLESYEKLMKEIKNEI